MQRPVECLHSPSRRVCPRLAAYKPSRWPERRAERPQRLAIAAPATETLLGELQRDYRPSEVLSPMMEAADNRRVFGLCRYCGDELSRARRPLEICAACEDSPLCDRCGHPRFDHTHVFVGGVRVGCNRRVGDFQTGTSWSCDCEGFRPIVGGLSQASFASAGAEDDAPMPRLRSVPFRSPVD